MEEYKNINKLQSEDRYMVKTIYEKYLEDLRNIGVNPLSSVAREFWISMSYPFQYNLLNIFHVEVKVKVRKIENDSLKPCGGFS